MARAIGWPLVVLAVLAAVAGAAVIWSQATSGAQPWSNELSDNFVFAKVALLALGLGVAVGARRGFAAAGATPGRQPGGAAPRFGPGTAIGHAVVAVGVLLALPTGAWQYLGGILDVTAPIPLFLFYRVHYVGATLILFSAGSFATYWWLAADRPLLVPLGQWSRQLRGMAAELPRPLGGALARVFRIDLTQLPPEAGRFSSYEKVFSFPTWTFAIALITVTGVIKAVRYVLPVPGPVLYWSSTLHVAAMVIIVVRLLDHLRYTLARGPLMAAMIAAWTNGGVRRRVAAGLGLLWALGNLLLAYLFVTSAFASKTAAKEGLPAQLALLVGGALIGVFAVGLLWLCARIISPRGAAAG